MKDYLSFRHISVETQPSLQSLIDRPLGEAGLQRHLAVHLPYFLAAIRMLDTTNLALTMPAHIAAPVAELHDLVSLKAPKEIPPIRYSMVWHPRFESDPLICGLERQCVRFFILLFLASRSMLGGWLVSRNLAGGWPLNCRLQANALICP
jgi:DNA-binding transcriptional LysR family regulator